MKTVKSIEAPSQSLARVGPAGLPAAQMCVDVPYTRMDNRQEWARFPDLGRVIARHKGVIFSAVLAGLLGGGALSYWSTPSYRASTALEVQGINEDFLDLRKIEAVARPDSASLDSYIQTQADLLQDDMMLDRVIQKLQLADDPSFRPKEGLTAIAAEMLPWRPPQVWEPPRPIDILREKLKVSPSRHSSIIRISYESPNPELAANLVNTLANEFIDYNLEARMNAASQIGQWLQPQIKEMKERLERSETELSGLSEATGLFTTPGVETVAEDRLRQLQRELAAAQGDRITKESIYRLAAQTPADALPQALETTSLKENQAKLTDLRRQRAELSTLYTDDNYRVVKIQAQIDELEAAAQREIRSIPNRAKSDYDAAVTREMALAKAYDSQAALVGKQARERIRYESLKRAVDDNRQIYQSTLQRVNEAGIASAIKPSGVRVVGAATPPVKPYRPNFPLNLSLGLTAGLCLGLVSAATMERARRVLRMPGELQAYVGLPELGVIPSATSHSLYSSRRKPLLDLRPEVHLELATWEEKHSAVSESFREVLTSLVYSDKVKTLLVTSANPMEGKTTIVTNLAIALADIGKKVLLIDGDMRKPRLHQIFDQPDTWGLSDILSGQGSLQDLPVNALAKKTSIPGLSLLPSGPVTEHITNLLYSPRMQELMDRLERDFDYILVDAPPVLSFSDARVLAHATDSVVLVTRANKTNPEAVREAASRFQSVGVPILGVILNDCDQRTLSQYGYGYQYR